MLLHLFNPDAFTWIRRGVGAVVAGLTAWLGNQPAIVTTLLIIMFADLAVGVARALVDRRMSLQKSWKGATKKGVVLILVTVAYRLQGHFGGGVPLAEATAGFYAWHYGLSMLQNATLMGLPVPDFLREAMEAMDRSQKGHAARVKPGKDEEIGIILPPQQETGDR